jgi:hypothetical protein
VSYDFDGYGIYFPRRQKFFFSICEKSLFFGPFLIAGEFFQNILWLNSQKSRVFPKIENANSPFSRELRHFSIRLFAERFVLLSSDV